uniref:Uncharacterized protein n=1 Tax=Panagrolaimus sp. ES5 TaxID=591445 RepID=A0AC34F7B8_9BILA
MEPPRPQLVSKPQQLFRSVFPLNIGQNFAGIRGLYNEDLSNLPEDIDGIDDGTSTVRTNSSWLSEPRTSAFLLETIDLQVRKLY